MIGAFSFKGISSFDFGLTCQSVNRPLLPPVKSNLIDLTGTSGMYDTGKNEYDLRHITMRIQFLIPENNDWNNVFYNLRKKVRDIASWLNSKSWERLIIVGEEDKYYLAKVEDELQLTALLNFGMADITFICQPFAYAQTIIYSSEFPGGVLDPDDNIDNPTPDGTISVTFNNIFNSDNLFLINSLSTSNFKMMNKNIITFANESENEVSSSSLEFFYGGTRHVDKNSPYGSKFNISFTVDETATFTLNGKSLSYNGDGNYIIDNVNMNIINGDFNNLSGDVGTFLSVIPGENTLLISGAYNIEVSIIPLFY